MGDSKRAAKSITIMILLSIVTKLMGFIREVFIAYKFGSGVESDTFFIATASILMFTTLYGTAINTTMIPVISEIENEEGNTGVMRFTNNILNIVMSFSFFFMVILWFLAPVIIKVVAKGFIGDQYMLAIRLMRIGLPVMFFSGIVWVLRGFLQTKAIFIESSLVNFPHNFVYIIYILFFANRFGVIGLTVASVVAIASQVLVQIPYLKSIAFKYRFRINIKDKYLRKLLILSGPVFIGVAINDLNIIVDRTLASSLVSGSISALNYANKLNGLILGIFITAITTVTFPLLSKEMAKNGISGLRTIMNYTIKYIMLITIPASVILIILSKEIVEVSFQSGAFGANATYMTSEALVYYSYGLLAMSLRLFLNKVYYALQDTKTPMINGIISVLMNIILNIILIKYMAHSGLALATSISSTISTLLLLKTLNKKIGKIEYLNYLNVFIKVVIASLFMSFVTKLSYELFYSFFEKNKFYSLLGIVLSVIIGMIVYILLCLYFNIPEVKKIKEQIFKKH